MLGILNFIHVLQRVLETSEIMHIQAYLRDIAGWVLDHSPEANINFFCW